MFDEVSVKPPTFLVLGIPKTETCKKTSEVHFKIIYFARPNTDSNIIMWKTKYCVERFQFRSCGNKSESLIFCEHLVTVNSRVVTSNITLY